MEDKDKTYVNEMLSYDKNRMAENIISARTCLSLRIRTLRDIRWNKIIALAFKVRSSWQLEVWHLVYIYIVWRAYWSLFGFGVLSTACHLCSHSDACRVSGNCVCRHLTSASFRSTLWGGRLMKWDLYAMWEEILFIVILIWVDISVLHNGKPIGYWS